jgi:tRNA(Ile)-lysidine synthase
VRILVACSGGPDSVALLGLLDLLAPAERLALTVGHIDHGLRETSRTEAALVCRLADRLGWPVSVERLSLAAGAGLPARARDARREALRRQARRANANIIALGHTATDQAETMLLHLARGAGLRGLSAMPAVAHWPDATGAWLRPLLAVPRERTRALAQRLGLEFVDDPTNLDPSHPRIAVRTAVLPVLRQIHAGADEAMAAAALRVSEADQALATWVAHALDERRIPTEGETCFALRGVSALPAAVRTGWIRAACLAGGVDPSALGRRAIASIDLALLTGGKQRQWDLHPNLRVWLTRDHLRVSRCDKSPDVGMPPRGHAGCPEDTP